MKRRCGDTRSLTYPTNRRLPASAMLPRITADRTFGRGDIQALRALYRRAILRIVRFFGRENSQNSAT